MIAAIISASVAILILFLPIKAAISLFLNLNKPQMAYRAFLYNLIPVVSGAVFVDGSSLVIVGKKAKRVEIASLISKPSSGTSVIKGIRVERFQIDMQLSLLGEHGLQKAQILAALAPLLTAVAAGSLKIKGSINTTYTLFEEKLLVDVILATSVFSLLTALLRKK